jgi:uncharacterized membrane protein YphA (DoxX/SURF4 family)
LYQRGVGENRHLGAVEVDPHPGHGYWTGEQVPPLTRGRDVARIAYWVTTVLLGLAYLAGGFVDLVQPADFAEQFAKLGYPALFFRILGVWKLAGGVVVLLPGLPRAKEWAYAGFVINLTAAAATHVSIGDPPTDLTAPAVLLAFTVASWALRPASRRLAGPCV